MNVPIPELRKLIERTRLLPSPTEMLVWAELANGRTIKEIAYDRGVSYKTVENQKAQLMRKIEARTTADLTRLAVAHGVIVVELIGKRA